MVAAEAVRKLSASNMPAACVIEATRRKSRIRICDGCFAKLPRYIVDGGKSQRADQFDDAHFVVALFEDLLVARLAAPSRGDAADVVIGDDRGAHVAGAVEHMQTEMGRQRLADFQSPHAVAVGVERRRKGAETELRGQRRDDAAADPALRRHADAINPLAGIIVHARTGHDRQRPRHRIGRHDLAPVIGLTPLLASVAAMMARSRAVTSTEHWRK